MKVKMYLLYYWTFFYKVEMFQVNIPQNDEATWMCSKMFQSK